MSVLLSQSPHIIDTFLSPFPPTIDFVLAETDYETRLERLRRFVNEGLFQNYHAFLTGMKDWHALAEALTGQAERVLDAALTIARDDLDAPDLAIAVVGMGKLGQSRMMPQSDLDLIFLFDDEVDRDLATKAVRRLNTILSTPLREGIAYELDTRLRPSGRSGPAAVTLSAFRRHHAEAAKTWEHIALVPARIVAGDPALGREASTIIAEVLDRPRDPEQLINDAHYMWSKIAEERIKPVPADKFGAKLRDGGGMMADFWDAVGRLSGGPRLPRACEGWAELLYWERLLGLTDLSVSDVPPAYAALMPPDLPTLQADLEQQVQQAVASYGPPNPSADMAPIRWAD
jgi:glutamate-ammonia-ligase adenylyltransferase